MHCKLFRHFATVSAFSGQPRVWCTRPVKARILSIAVTALALTRPVAAQPPEPACNSYVLKKDDKLSWKQKFCYYRDNKIVSGTGLFGAAFFAAIAQWQDSPKEWPLGAEGYGRRLGTRYAQGLAKSTGTFLAGAVNHEDPRHYPSEAAGNQKPSFGRRLGHAILRTVWTQRDSGGHFIAMSTIGGAFSSGFIGRAWTPDRQNTLGQAMIRTGTAFGGNLASSIFAEFQPDLAGISGKIMGQRKPKK